MRLQLALVCGVLVLAHPGAAEESVDPRVKAALEKANDIPDFASLVEATLKKTKSGWVVTWKHPIGDSGFDECRATFKPTGALETQRCRVEYVTHSMGPGNARWTSSAEWTFDASGALTRFSGSRKSVVLATGKVGENTRYSKPSDELLGDLCKPLMKLDESMLR